MELDIRYFKRAVLVSISGRIDRINALLLSDELCGLIKEGHTNIVLDLSGVDYLVTEGLRTNLKALRDCKNGGGDLRIASPSQRVREILEMGGHDKIYAIYDDPISAVGSF